MQMQKQMRKRLRPKGWKAPVVRRKFKTNWAAALEDVADRWIQAQEIKQEYERKANQYS